ncbi:hypothetical protein TL16_g12113 [Triparma laevis f. inornata]|uniref:Uncharacterized protein n=1 Tax=Triparma laevis f. inornata TaxID=1714386 RepID=A0A9W7BJM0_9STRA|nr:hypothetical protein TL16_g12113 [Triparma laevis f. inornata]
MYVLLLFLLPLLVSPFRLSPPSHYPTNLKSFYPSDFPSPSIISSLTLTLPTSLGLFISTPSPFALSGTNEAITNYLNNKTPSPINSNTDGNAMCVIDNKGTFLSLFTYLPSFKIIIPTNSELRESFSKTIFPMDGVEIIDSNFKSIDVISLKSKEELENVLGVQVYEKSFIIENGFKGLKRFGVLIPTSLYSSFLSKHEPQEDSEIIYNKLLKIPTEVFSYYTITEPPPCSEILNIPTPLDLGLNMLIDPIKKCYSGAEGFKRTWKKIEGTGKTEIRGRRKVCIIRFNAIENENRVEDFLDKGVIEGEMEYDYPPLPESKVFTLSGEDIGVVINVAVGFEDTVGLGCLKRSACEKFNVKNGMRVKCGGSIGVLEEIDVPKLEVEREKEEKKEEENDSESKAMKKQERMEELKRKAKELIERRNASK